MQDSKNSPQINLNAILKEVWNHADEIREDTDSGEDLNQMSKAIKERAERIMQLLDPFVAPDQSDNQ